jgi:hypothetical protein
MQQHTVSSRPTLARRSKLAILQRLKSFAAPRYLWPVLNLLTVMVVNPTVLKSEVAKTQTQSNG